MATVKDESWPKWSRAHPAPPDIDIKEESFSAPQISKKRVREDTSDSGISQVRKKLRRLAQSSDRLLLRQYQLQHEEQTLAGCGSFVKQSADEVVQLTASVLDGVDLNSCHDQLEEAHLRLKNDIETFTQRSSSVQTLRHEVTQDQSRVKTRTENLSDLLENTPMAFHLRSLEELQGEQVDVETNTSSARSTSNSNTPTLLAQLYDRKGDIGIFQDRLGELEYNFQDGLVEREMIRDRGDPLQISDEQYYEQYVQERKTILGDLEKAEQDASELERRCRETGLEITTYRTRPSSSEALSSNEQAILAPIIPVLATSDPMFRQRGLADVFSQPSNRSEARVQTWLDNVPQGDATPTMPEAYDSILERARTAESDRNRYNSAIWRSYRTGDVATAASMLPGKASPLLHGSKSNFGLSMRRWNTDPGCLPRPGNHIEPVPLEALLSIQARVEDSPDMQRPSTAMAINTASPEFHNGNNNKSSPRRGQSSNRNWLRGWQWW